MASDQSGQPNQTASEQRQETRLRKHRRLDDGGRSIGICNQDQHKQSSRAQVSHDGNTSQPCNGKLCSNRAILSVNFLTMVFSAKSGALECGSYGISRGWPSSCASFCTCLPRRVTSGSQQGVWPALYLTNSVT